MLHHGGFQMSRQEYEYPQLKITELLLNSENPRFNPVKHQTEAIGAMIEDQGDKLIVLAQHILDFGMNPTDIPLVCPHEKQWLVLDGNRRITVLKLANEPNLVPEKYPGIRKAFQQLNAYFDSTLFENISCVAVQDKGSANEWIRLKHTGQNKGAGTVDWDAQQTSRFKMQTSEKIDERLVFLDKLKDLDGIPQEYKERFIDIKKTNFDRLMGDPDIRILLGISNKGNTFSLTNGVNQYLLAVLYDLAFNDLSVGKIYHKEDRKKYIEEIKAKVTQSELSENLIGANVNDKTKGNENTNNGQIPLQDNWVDNAGRTDNEDSHGNAPISKASHMGRERGYPVNRKTLIPAHHKLTISHPRILKIFNELKALDIVTYPNASAVLFRVFIELSADCYIDKYTLSTVNSDDRLAKKLEVIIAHLKDNMIMKENDLRAARQLSSSQTQNNSVKTFHSYVHNRHITPSADDLKSAWDDLWTFTENIWR